MSDEIKIGDRLRHIDTGTVFEAREVGEAGWVIVEEGNGTWGKIGMGLSRYLTLRSMISSGWKWVVAKPEPTPEERWAEHLRQEKEIAAKMDRHRTVAALTAGLPPPPRWPGFEPFTRGHWEPSTSGLAGGSVGVWRK